MESNKDKTEIEAEVRHILSFHKGKANPVGRWELVERIFGREAAANRGNNNPFDRQIRQAIEKYRIPDFICSTSGQAGYWIADDMDDIESVAVEFEKRATQELDKARNLRKRGMERFGGQMSLLKGN